MDICSPPCEFTLQCGTGVETLYASPAPQFAVFPRILRAGAGHTSSPEGRGFPARSPVSASGSIAPCHGKPSAPHVVAHQCHEGVEHVRSHSSRRTSGRLRSSASRLPARSFHSAYPPRSFSSSSTAPVVPAVYPPLHVPPVQLVEQCFLFQKTGHLLFVEVVLLLPRGERFVALQFEARRRRCFSASISSVHGTIPQYAASSSARRRFSPLPLISSASGGAKLTMSPIIHWRSVPFEAGTGRSRWSSDLKSADASPGSPFPEKSFGRGLPDFPLPEASSSTRRSSASASSSRGRGRSAATIRTNGARL